MNAAGRHAEITGRVLKKGTSTPLPRVKVIASNGIKTFEDVTDVKGNYKLSVSPELYNVQFILPNYQEVQVNDVLVDAAQKQVVNSALQSA